MRFPIYTWFPLISETRYAPGHMRFAYGIVSGALDSVATEIKRYKSGIGIGIQKVKFPAFYLYFQRVTLAFHGHCRNKNLKREHLQL